MKNLKKKNNKGFSLVELIVVVMIMAILAVALAPQVMKWVGNSRKSADVNTYESLVSSLQIALANEDVYDELDGQDVTVQLASGGITFLPTTATVTELKAELVTLLGAGYDTKITAKVGTYTILLDNGAVTKGTVPATDMD